MYALCDDGIRRPDAGVVHRDDEYEEASFASLADMQQRHFWYLGRHRFFRAAFERHVRREQLTRDRGIDAVDLGGGCGGWVRYLADCAHTSPTRERGRADATPSLAHA